MRRAALVLTLLLAAAAACSRTGGTDTLPPLSAVEVRTTNNYALPVEIFASGSGIRQRLGTVHPGMSADFRLPPNLVGGGAIEFEAQPASNGQPFRSGQVLVSPGALVDIVVAPQIFNSTVRVR